MLGKGPEPTWQQQPLQEPWLAGLVFDVECSSSSASGPCPAVPPTRSARPRLHQVSNSRLQHGLNPMLFLPSSSACAAPAPRCHPETETPRLSPALASAHCPSLLPLLSRLLPSCSRCFPLSAGQAVSEQGEVQAAFPWLGFNGTGTVVAGGGARSWLYPSPPFFSGKEGEQQPNQTEFWASSVAFRDSLLFMCC